jgi:hypothetical protein
MEYKQSQIWKTYKGKVKIPQCLRMSNTLHCRFHLSKK